MMARSLFPLLLIALDASPLTQDSAPSSGTVALTYELGSPIVTLTLLKTDGTARPARFLVDTGGGSLMLTESLALELGLQVERGSVWEQVGMDFAPIAPPRIEIESMPLDLGEAGCLAVLGSRSILSGATPEGLLPGRILMRHHVVFDYPAGRFTMARPGVLQPRGTAVPTPVNDKNGFPRIEVEIGGKPFGFRLDTGASFTMVAAAQLEAWKRNDPTLPSMIGATGEANMLANRFEMHAQVMTLPTMRLGEFTLEGVAAVERGTLEIENVMSDKMSAPIVGALGSNLLRHFRVEIDYAAGTTWLEPAGKDFSTKLVAVGLVLGATPEGGHRVENLVFAGRMPLCRGVQIGDLIRSIDGQPVDALCHRQVVELLCGDIGSSRTLVLDRAGQEVEVTVPVVQMLTRPPPSGPTSLAAAGG